MDLNDHIVVIIGGATDLGRGLALSLAEAGAAVVIGDTDSHAADGFAVQAQIESEGGQALFSAVDPGDDDSIQTMIGEAVLTFGAVDGLVTVGPVLQAADADEGAASWRHLLDRQLRDALLASKYCLPFLRKSAHRPCIVNVSRSEAPGDGSGVLEATGRAGLIAMTGGLARSHGAQGVRANAVVCDYIDTPEARRRLESRGLTIEGTAPALARWGQPEEVAAAVIFLLSEAAAFVTGCALTVDGGR